MEPLIHSFIVHSQYYDFSSLLISYFIHLFDIRCVNHKHKQRFLLHSSLAEAFDTFNFLTRFDLVLAISSSRSQVTIQIEIDVKSSKFVSRNEFNESAQQ